MDKNRIEEWFECPVRIIEDEIFFNEDKQSRVISQLADRGLMSTEKRGFPATRWVRIDLEAIAGLIFNECEDAKTQQIRSPGTFAVTAKTPPQSTQKCRDCANSVNRSNIDKSRPSPKAQDNVLSGGFFDDPNSTREISVEEVLAQKLLDGLSRKRKIIKRPRISNWASEIRKFLEITNYSPEEFESTMLNYLERIDDEYMPVAFCAATFCEKYPKILTALQRKSTTNGAEDQAARVAKLLEKKS